MNITLHMDDEDVKSLLLRMMIYDRWPVELC